jgi:AcrR family transcriptional regulator
MPVLEAPAAASLGAQEERIVDAALRCYARWGLAKTTLDDIAREAGYSRATVYRVFPGGKDGLFDSVVATEVLRAYAAIAERLEAATDLEDLLVAGIAGAARIISEHKALQFFLAHEPEVVLPRISFHEADHVLRGISAFAAPYLARWVDPSIDALRAAEWIARIVLSYTCSPSPRVDLGDDASVRMLVRTFVLPGLAST